MRLVALNAEKYAIVEFMPSEFSGLYPYFRLTMVRKNIRKSLKYSFICFPFAFIQKEGQGVPCPSFQICPEDAAIRMTVITALPSEDPIFTSIFILSSLF